MTLRNGKAAIYERALELERQLHLAQTEIKGHMRVEDELKVRIARYEALDAHLPSGYAIGDDATAELAVELAQAQARIATLEEELRRSKNGPA